MIRIQNFIWSLYSTVIPVQIVIFTVKHIITYYSIKDMSYKFLRYDIGEERPIQTAHLYLSFRREVSKKQKLTTVKQKGSFRLALG